MLPFDTLEMTRERLDDSSRQDGRSILLTLASADDDLPSFEIDVFDAELQALMQPQSGLVQESGDRRAWSGTTSRGSARRRDADCLQRLKLDVATIVGIHGNPAPMSQFPGLLNKAP